MEVQANRKNSVIYCEQNACDFLFLFVGMVRYAIRDNYLRLIKHRPQVKYNNHNALSSKAFRERSFFEKLDPSLVFSSFFP